MRVIVILLGQLSQVMALLTRDYESRTEHTPRVTGELRRNRLMRAVLVIAAVEDPVPVPRRRFLIGGIRGRQPIPRILWWTADAARQIHQAHQRVHCPAYLPVPRRRIARSLRSSWEVPKYDSLRRGVL